MERLAIEFQFDVIDFAAGFILTID